MDLDIDDILADLDHHDANTNEDDLQELTRSWVAERVAPELMPWPEKLIKRINDRLSKQIEYIEDKAGSMDPKTNFAVIVMQTELERFKFLLRSFLRARLSKIDSHPLHYALLSSNDPLSSSERQYLETHQSLLSHHYSAAFLSQLPQALQRLDDRAAGMNMVETPDMDRAVFIRGLRDVGPVATQGTSVVCDVMRGDVWVMRWSSVKELVEKGDVELL